MTVPDCVRAIRLTAKINRGQASQVVLVGFETLADELERRNIEATAPHSCEALCPCCSKRCSGKHVNRIHGVDHDNHWSGAAY